MASARVRIPYGGFQQLQGLAPTADTILTGNTEAFAADLDARIARASASIPADSPEVLLVEKLRTALHPARERLRALTFSLNALASEAMKLATEMDFAFLLDRSRLLLSIGYEMETQHLHQACYDMLSSEARIAAFITVAKGEAPQLSWFKLGRTHTLARERPLPLSGLRHPRHRAQVGRGRRPGRLSLFHLPGSRRRSHRIHAKPQTHGQAWLDRRIWIL